VIPVEQIRAGDTVYLPNGREMGVVRVETYDEPAGIVYVVVYRDGDIEKQLRIMHAGDPVNATAGPTMDTDTGDLAEHEAGRQQLLELYRRHGPMPDSEIVERCHERDADAGRTLTAVSTLMRRRRELERRDLIEETGSRYHPESGATEPLFMVSQQPEQLSVAREYQPEPDF
jgi:hypothetical protein